MVAKNTTTEDTLTGDASSGAVAVSEKGPGFRFRVSVRRRQMADRLNRPRRRVPSGDRARLVDELRMFRNPVVVGGGTTFLPPVTEDIPLDLIETRTFGPRVIYERHARVRGRSD